MGWVMMSERDLNRIEVLSQVDDGASAIRHKSLGKVPNNQIHRAKRDYALTLIKETYADFGPTLAAEMLEEQHGFTVSRETLRKWMVEDGIWLPRKERRKFHQPRLRRECLGELIQPLSDCNAIACRSVDRRL
jgi:hypothetical protein